MKGRILSGMRPTGRLHLGHLVGALSNWVELQDEYDCYYMIADWHALMSEYANSLSIRGYIRDNVIDWLSCGIDSEKATIFIQTQIPFHSELHLVLSTVTPIGWLERCPTYKEQLKELKNKDVNNYAFLGYPVLQAADILLYKGNYVPVGEDQLPHLELTREIVRRFHHLFNCEVFPEPEAKLTEFSRLTGTDGRKMSKSYDNYIGLSEDMESVSSKIMKMFTDPARLRRKDPGTPEKCNVFSYHKAFNGSGDLKGIAEGCRTAGIGCTDCKNVLLEAITKVLLPIQEKRKHFLENPEEVDKIISNGNKKAHEVAKATMGEVYTSIFGTSYND